MSNMINAICQTLRVPTSYASL